ncbi:MAG: bifunctional oligoribonuclease/PAP phosphatase NrnA [Candidatus Gracilibacteria bacterium]
MNNDSTQFPFSPEQLQEVKNLLQSAQRIVIISHRGPDGDTLGANLALKHALKQWGKEAISACVDAPPEYSFMLDGIFEFVNDFDLTQTDLVIAVDCGAHYLMKFHETKPGLLGGKIPLINIDHHPSNDRFGTHNLVDADAAACSLILYDLLLEWGFTITRDMATALLMGLYYDTGSFMHSNTTPKIMETAAQLLNRGADMKRIVKALFHTNPIPQLHLWGRVLSRTRISEKRAVVSAATKKDYTECQADPDHLSGVIDYLNSVPESRFSVLLSEDQKGNVKGSFRTQSDDVDVSELAALFGGGGHKKAAGFTIKGHLQPETVWKIVE